MTKADPAAVLESPVARQRPPAPVAIAVAPRPRHVGAINWLGVRTLYLKEVHRFVKVFAQTVLAPTLTTLLFLAIFSLALGGAVRRVGDVPFINFLAPGLVMMAIVQNAFANTSSSMMIGKVQGCIVDMLMPPFGPGELTFALVMGGVTRGVLVGVAVTLAMAVFVPMAVHNYAALVFYPVAASVMLSLLGVIVAIWADKFDHMAAITNFVITPLAFLSGTFYSVERLPEPWHLFSQLNPFFYMIDGFRYAFIGQADGSLAVGVAVLIVTNAGLWLLCRWMFASGYKLKE
ncbi:MAG: ABC transporter permease [Alphaproteobacteria bacterium]|jgi:ABC-2 type transport system permease protein|nr:ABC transporter permease [Alphaproteobacteria bacterium]MDP6516087.1 ABC transporter permease [Alphaproteobacteria bacterium]